MTRVQLVGTTLPQRYLHAAFSSGFGGFCTACCCCCCCCCCCPADGDGDAASTCTCVSAILSDSSRVSNSGVTGAELSSVPMASVSSACKDGDVTTVACAETSSARDDVDDDDDDDDDITEVPWTSSATKDVGEVTIVTPWTSSPGKGVDDLTVVC